MEKRLNEIEFDEFEKLLGEIPSATSGNPSSQDSGVTNSQKRAFNEKLVNDHGRLDEGKVSPNRIQQSDINIIQQIEPNLPDDQSLTSAFTELSFKDGGIAGSASPLVNDTSFMLNGQYTNGFKNFTSNMDPHFIVTPPGSANISPIAFGGFDVNVQGLKKQQTGYCQPIENFAGAVPLCHGVQGFHLVPNVPVPGIEFPIIPNQQQQLYIDAPSGLPYIHPQQLSQPQITWRHVEEEHYYRMHQQFLYLQQLRNHQLEGPRPIQENGNFVRLMNRNARHLCQDKPVSYHLEQCKQEPFWSKTIIPRNTNQLRSTFPSADVHSGRVSDQVGNHKFPEKILTRANGLNSLRSVKFGSFGGKEPILNVNYNGRVLPREYCNHGMSTQNVELQMDNPSSRGLSTGIFDFKLNNTKSQLHNSLEEFTGRIYLMAKDQHGCRFLQRKFTEGNHEDVEKIFLEIITNIVELMMDPFGNYLVQKLLEVCDEDQQMQILHSITRKPGDLVRISCDMHGTRSVQKVIETLKTEEQFSIIVSALKPGIVTIIKNMNGNHVAQRCLQYLSSEYCEFLFDAATANCVDLATDRHGCCVLQKCLNHSDEEERHRLVHEITSNALILSQDPFGNYVVQYVFEIHVPWATAEILDQLEGNFVDLSIQKYSSNVVEKCLKYAGEERRISIIQELINSTRIDQILQDPYGNYVVQAALNLSKGPLHVALVEAIRTNVHVLRSSPYAKKVLSSNGLKK